MSLEMQVESIPMQAERRTLLILVDYLGAFYSRTENAMTNATMYLDKIVAYFQDAGFDVEVSPFAELDLQQRDFNGCYVLYQSSEDRLLLYKSFIEDMLLGLQMRGAILIPAYHYLRAHHNKIFMEILRSNFKDERLKTLQSRYFGTYEELRDTRHPVGFPAVLKPSEGGGSTGVSLANDWHDLNRQARRISLGLDVYDLLAELKRRISRFRYGYHRRSIHRRKFIVQNFIPDLPSDMKVLVFGDKYYVLTRQNRPNDFRASGGGRLQQAEGEPCDALLDFAQLAKRELNVPYCSLDIGFDGERHHLIEFQCVMFGPLTLTTSKGYYTSGADGWQWVAGESDYEEVFCKTVIDWIANT